MQKLEIKQITPERANECIEFIQTAIDMDFDSYLEFFHSNK